jgi:hypothetical protein
LVRVPGIVQVARSSKISAHVIPAMIGGSRLPLGASRVTNEFVYPFVDTVCTLFLSYWHISILMRHWADILSAILPRASARSRTPFESWVQR